MEKLYPSTALGVEEQNVEEETPAQKTSLYRRRTDHDPRLRHRDHPANNSQNRLLQYHAHCHPWNLVSSQNCNFLAIDASVSWTTYRVHVLEKCYDDGSQAESADADPNRSAGHNHPDQNQGPVMYVADCLETVASCRESAVEHRQATTIADHDENWTLSVPAKLSVGLVGSRSVSDLEKMFCATAESEAGEDQEMQHLIA